MVTILAFIVLGGGTALGSFVIFSNSQLGPGTVSGHNPPAGKHSNIIRRSVYRTDLATAAVANGKLAPGAVGTGKLASGAVTTGKLASGAVTTGTLASGAVTAGKLAGDSVNGSTILNRSVSGADIGLGTIKGENLATDDAGQALGLRKGAAERFVGESGTFYSGSFFSLAASCIDSGSGTRTAQIDINLPNGGLLTKENAVFLQLGSSTTANLVSLPTPSNASQTQGVDFSVLALGLDPPYVQGRVQAANMAAIDSGYVIPACRFRFYGLGDD
jgi:hypothetical protein